MIYSIAFEVKSSEVRERIKSEAEKLGDVSPFLTSSILLSTPNTSNDNAFDIYERLRHIIDSSDQLVVSRVDKDNLMGWLNKDVVDWLKRQSNT